MGIMEPEFMVKKDLEYYEQEIWHLPVMYYFPCQFVSIASYLLV